MNRTQLPGELKAVVCQQIRRGKWTVEQAADITTFTVGSIKRWLRDLPSSSPEGPAAPPATKVAEPRPLEPGLRRILDEALERVPLLRQRSLVNYVRRHYGLQGSQTGRGGLPEGTRLGRADHGGGGAADEAL